MTTLAAFRAIEGANSDGDPTGATNVQEINANAQPGWTPGPSNTIYDMADPTQVAATGQNPPSITGTLDPASAPPPPAANRPPVLSAIGAKAVNEGQPLTFTATATDPDGNALTFSGGNLPTGAILNATTGAFSWTPTFAQAGNYNVTITVTDNGSPAASDFETITITVGNVNRPPVLNSIGAKSVNEGQPLAFTATASDPDGNALTFSGGNLPTGASLNATTGAFSWTPTFSQAGNYSVTITVTDNGGPAASDFETITITVGNVNQPPVLNPIGAKTATVGQALTFTAAASDPDGNALTFSGGNLPTGASLNATTGAFSWTPAANQTGSFSVTVTVTDNGTPAQTDTETITITVGAGNRPPVLNPIGAKSVNEGQALTFTATASDPDGGPLTFAGVNLPAGATLNATTGVFSWTPGFTQAGNYDVTVTVSDGTLIDSEVVTITVGNVNRPPVLSPSPVGNRTVTEGQPLTIAFTATDPDGNTLTFTSANLPSGATLTPSGPGAATFSWTPQTGQAGSYPSVTVTVSDGALTDAEAFTITVSAATPVNQAPTVTNPGNKTVTAGSPLSFTIIATDPNAGQTRTFSAGTTLPAGATLSASGAFAWTPTAAQASATPYSVTVTATDNGSPALTSTPQTFTITVQAVTSPPPPPTTSSLSIKEAEWEHSKLHVHGRVTPGNVQVTIVDAATGKTIGTVLATRGGEFERELRVSPAPCRIQAKANGQSSAVVTVKGACRRSRGGED